MGDSRMKFSTTPEWDDIEYFSEEEFKCHCGCDQTEMDMDFVERLNELRDKLGYPLRISSGYRCPEHNNNVSSTGIDGPHTTGKAADILINYNAARELLSLAVAFSGIGINQKGPPGARFIHLDDLGFRLWTY